MRPYLSIDIETTGIDDRSEILQISGVIDDLSSAIGKLKTFDLPIKHESIEYSEPYALGMNADLFKKMMDKDFVTYSPIEAIDALVDNMAMMQEAYKDEKGKKQKIIFSGKNVANFDLPKIRNFIIKHDTNRVYLKNFDNMVHYKTLDVGSLYYDVFKDNVSLSKINELTGRKAVSHNALYDAFDVVFAVRHKLGVSNE